MELQIGCFEYSMELENGKLSGTLYLSAKPSKTQRAHVLHETDKARTEVTQITSKIMETCFKPEVIQCLKTNSLSRQRGSLMPLAYKVFPFSQNKVHRHWTFVQHLPNAIYRHYFISLIIYYYWSLTSDASAKDCIMWWHSNNIVLPSTNSVYEFAYKFAYKTYLKEGN